jgi:hypothetical protein
MFYGNCPMCQWQVIKRVHESPSVTHSSSTVKMKHTISHTLETYNAVLWKFLRKYLVCKSFCSATKLGQFSQFSGVPSSEFFLHSLQLAVEPPQLPSQWVPWNIFAGVK